MSPGYSEAPTLEPRARSPRAATAAGGAVRSPRQDKSRWVDTIEQALLAGEIDLAVHSAKDVPGELAEGLELLGAPARADARGRALRRGWRWTRSPSGARVGTSSLRRAAQLRARTRGPAIVRAARQRRHAPAKRTSGEESCDAIVLARAGLQRLGREAEIGAVLDPHASCPLPARARSRWRDAREDARVREAVQRDHRRGCVRVPAGRARAGARAGRQLPHAARRSRARPPAAAALQPARLGRSARRLGLGRATSCSAASTTRPRSGSASRSACWRPGAGGAAAPGGGDGR